MSLRASKPIKQVSEVNVLKNRLIVGGIFVGLIVLFVAGPGMAQYKLGYIDSQRILMTYSAAVDAQKKLEGERNAASEELQRLQDEFRTSQQQLEKQSMLLTEEKRSEREGELQNLLIRIQQFQQDKEQELMKRRDELLQPVYQSINNAIKKVSEEGGYDFVFDAVNLMHAKEQYDLTDKILEVLNQQGSGGAADTSGK
jgi:outer membrane protein